jgi:hypothetical protein
VYTLCFFFMCDYTQVFELFLFELFVFEVFELFVFARSGIYATSISEIF